MRGLLLLVLAVGLAGCVKENADPSEFYPVKRFLEGDEKSVHQWTVAWFFASDGQRVHWTGDTHSGPPVVVVQPGFEEGQPVGWALTELWYDWPTPWEQPAYKYGMDPTVFGVDVDSTFYSPFWQVYDVQVKAPAGPFESAHAVLDAHPQLVPTFKVVCPIVPPGVTLAVGPSGHPEQPFTHAVFNDPRQKSFAPAAGVVDGHPVSYLSLSGSYRTDEVSRVLEGHLYRFARAGGDEAEVRRLPPVLPGGFDHVGLLREVRVNLPASADSFVPPDADGGVADLDRLGKTPLDPAIFSVQATADLVPAYTGRVALDPSCFSDQTRFPDGCTWLDSEGALLSNLGPSAFSQTEVLVTVSKLPGAQP